MNIRKSFVTSNYEIVSEVNDNHSHPLKVESTTNPNEKAINRVGLISKKNNQSLNIQRIKKNEPVKDWDRNEFIKESVHMDILNNSDFLSVDLTKKKEVNAILFNFFLTLYFVTVVFTLLHLFLL